MVQQESALFTGKLSPAIFHPSLMLIEACGSLLFSLKYQRCVYYNCIVKPFSSLFCTLLNENSSFLSF